LRGSLHKENNKADDTEERKKLRKDKTNIIRREKEEKTKVENIRQKQ
jgi:hypothetical protein